MQRYTPHFSGDPRALCVPGGQQALWADCSTVPTDGKAGYEKNCMIQATAQTTGAVGFYINLGTITSCAFRPVVVGSAIGQTTELTVTNTQLNLLTGLTATAAQLNSLGTASGRIVTTTATSLSLTAALHANKILVVNTNSSGTSTFTLPVASALGDRYTIVNGIVQTQGTIVIQADTTAPDAYLGVVNGLHTTTTTGGEAFISAGNKSTITLNKTTTGGLGFDWFDFWDYASNQWLLKGQISGSGSLATPLS